MPDIQRTAREGERHESPLAHWTSMPGLSRLLPALRSLLGEGSIPVEEFRDEGGLVVRVELPGIDPDKDVELTIVDHTLHIHAERREEKEAREKGWYRSQFRYGSISRSVPLPPGAREQDAQATYKAGILEIRVPVEAAAEGAGTKIPVRVVTGRP